MSASGTARPGCSIDVNGLLIGIKAAPSGGRYSGSTKTLERF